MAERDDIAHRQDRLPIKLILPSQGKEKPVPGGGSPPKPFRTVDEKYRRQLHTQVLKLREAVAPQVKQVGSAPIRVKLIPEASAKSHRPERIFSPDSCPIIGAGRLGELFMKATPKGLDQLADTIEGNRAERVIKELSCVETIEPITPTFRRSGVDAKDILKKSPRGEKGFLTRVRLFDFGPGDDQEKHIKDLRTACKARKLELRSSGYSPSTFTYEIECGSVDDVDALSRVIGVRSISPMPLIKTIRPRFLNQKPLPRNLPTGADLQGDFPVVVVVDSGVSKNVPALKPWIVGSQSDVAPQYSNTDHGTFVAGLIALGSEFNPNLAGVDSNPCGVFDLQVIPNGDPQRGDIDALTEREFLQSLETALKQYANRFKVWNLSLGTDEVCSLSEFSQLAVDLDKLQQDYKVSFVISAGNFTSMPLLDYPRTPEQLDPGRITSPADSVLGITVGSVSHIDYKRNGPREHHPSAFSRHGAGPNYVIKPDLVHYGGSCSTDASHQSGVRSLHGSGSAEDLGTSYAAPLVARTLAQVYHHLTPTPSPVLARGLLTHHARDPRNGGRIPDGEENFFGFGLPAPIPYCLECTRHSSTLVFEDTLRPGYFLEWDDFPYPPSLYRNGKFFGEVWMTVAFEPARGAKWGTEYCETHIDAHFGVYRGQKNRDTGVVKAKFVGLVPPEHKNPGILFESYQVEKLRKWAPVRTYHGDMGEKGERGERWRLMVKLLTRHGVEDKEAFEPQPFSLIITIADPQKKAPVYDEMARIIRTQYRAQNLEIRTAARIRGRN